MNWVNFKIHKTAKKTDIATIILFQIPNTSQHALYAYIREILKPMKEDAA